MGLLREPWKGFWKGARGDGESEFVLGFGGAVLKRI